MITTLDQLTPATRAVADAWLDSSVAVVEAGERDRVRHALTRALCEALHAEAAPEDVADAVARIGAIDDEASGPDMAGEAYVAGGDEAFVLAAGYPVLVLAAVVAHYAVRGRSLPGHLPTCWDSCGRATGHVTKQKAAVTDIGLALGGVALGIVSALARGRGPGRVGALVAASTLATVAGAVTLLRPLHRTS
ncbi:MAG: hypothetical protein IPL36_14250 [Nigerium sp.]|nr:hypothetical protein [Nigerium sp.]